MSNVAFIETELVKLSQAELREVRGHLDDLIEDEREFTPEFEASLRESEQQIKNEIASCYA
ncbi:MAG: hypothetical protein RLZZ350_2698 [Verrucomicrobiota bacterium]